MPKIGSLWVQSFQDKEGNTAIRHSGKVEIDGLKFFMDVYPRSSPNPQAPNYDVYLKPMPGNLGNHETDPSY